MVSLSVNPRSATDAVLIPFQSAFLRSFITADLADTHEAMNRLKEVKALAEEHLKWYERGCEPLSGQDNVKIADATQVFNRLLDCRIVYGDALYLIAILQMTRDAKLKGAFNLRKSWKVFEKALKDVKAAAATADPELSKCLHFGAGFFLFAMSVIPPKFLKLVELAGFKADKEAGLHYVKECQTSGGIRAPFATMLLLFNNLLLPRGLVNPEVYLAEANQLIQESLKLYPSGSLFHVMGSHCARKQCDIDKGIELMNTALDNSKTLKQPPLIYRYELANCYCMKMEWKKAADLYIPLIEEKNFQVRALCGLQLAACYTVLGKKDEALALFNRLPSLVGTKSHFDPIVQRQAKRYAANGGWFSAFELLYLRRDLAKMIPIIDEVLKALDSMASHTQATEKKVITADMRKGMLSKGIGSLKNLSPFAKKKEATDYSFDDRASYLLIRGSLLKALGRQKEAVECFKEVVDTLQDCIQEKLYLPYCMYELGESYHTQGKLNEAEEMMKRCAKISGYDWEDPLRIRLRVTMGQLKTRSSGSEEKPITSIESLTQQNIPDVPEDTADAQAEL